MTKYDKLTDLQRRTVVAEKVLGWKPPGLAVPDWSWSLFGQIVEKMEEAGFVNISWDNGHCVSFDGTYAIADHPA